MIKTGQCAVIAESHDVKSSGNIVPITESLNAKYNGKPFCSILEAVKETGLSAFYIRRGVRDGWIPHLWCGNKVVINMRLFLPILDDMSKQREDAE